MSSVISPYPTQTTNSPVPEIKKPEKDCKVVVLFDGNNSENVEAYCEKLLSIFQSFPKVSVETSISLESSYQEIIERETPTLGDRNLLILTLTDKSSLEELTTISSLAKAHLSSNTIFGFQVCQKGEKALDQYMSAANLEKYCAKELSKTEAITASKVSEFHPPILNMAHYGNVDKTLHNEFVATLRKAAMSNGFFNVINIQIDPEILDNALEQHIDFSKQPLAFKESCQRPESKGQVGFVPGEKAKRKEGQTGEPEKDKKEMFHIASRYNKTPNVWPNEKYAAAMTSLHDALSSYVPLLLQACIEAVNLGIPNEEDKLPLSYFDDKMGQGENNLLRALHYLAATKEELADPEKPFCWGAEHTDIDLLAFVIKPTGKGLQVEADGNWFSVMAPPDSFIVNIGDMFQSLTNRLFKSAKHRIVAEEPDQDRDVFAFFIHPSGRVSLKPLEVCVAQTGGPQIYSDGTRDELLWERLIELDIAPGLLDLYATTGHIERQMEYGQESPQVLEKLLARGYVLGSKVLQPLPLASASKEKPD